MKPVEMLDAIVTSFSDKAGYAVAAVNKESDSELPITLDFEGEGKVVISYISGDSTEAYNDIDHEGVTIIKEELGEFHQGMEIMLKPHSVNIIQVGVK